MAETLDHVLRPALPRRTDEGRTRTPSKLLRAAADRLDAMLTRLPDRWIVDVAGPLASTSWLGPSHDVLTATWPQGVYVDTMKPLVGAALVDVLRSTADVLDRTGAPGGEPLLRLARALLGEEQGQ